MVREEAIIHEKPHIRYRCPCCNNIWYFKDQLLEKRYCPICEVDVVKSQLKYQCPHCNIWYFKEQLVGGLYCPNCCEDVVESQEIELQESEVKQMNRELAELTVKSSADYNDKVVTALQDAGFVIVLRSETTTDKYYIVAESEQEQQEE